MFVYSQDDESFYKCLTESSGTFTEIFMMMIRQGSYELKNSSYLQDILYRILLRPYFYHRVTDLWKYELGWWKQGFLDRAEFSVK